MLDLEFIMLIVSFLSVLVTLGLMTGGLRRRYGEELKLFLLAVTAALMLYLIATRLDLTRIADFVDFVRRLFPRVFPREVFFS